MLTLRVVSFYLCTRSHPRGLRAARTVVHFSAISTVFWAWAAGNKESSFCDHVTTSIRGRMRVEAATYLTHRVDSGRSVSTTSIYDHTAMRIRQPEPLVVGHFALPTCARTSQWRCRLQGSRCSGHGNWSPSCLFDLDVEHFLFLANLRLLHKPT